MKANGSEPMVKSMYGSFYLLGVHVMWVPVNSTGKISNGWIRYLGSISAYTKNWLVFWFNDKELSSRANIIGWNSL